MPQFKVYDPQRPDNCYTLYRTTNGWGYGEHVQVFQAACFYDAIMIMWPSSFEQFRFEPTDTRNTRLKRIYSFNRELTRVLVEQVA